MAVIAFCCWIPVIASAQSHWSTAFLKTVYSQPKVQADSMILSQLTNEKYRSPLVRDIDIRLRSHRLSPEIEELRLRFDLLNPAMIAADKNYQVALKNYRETRSKVRINEYLLERYQLLIGHYQRSETIRNLEELLSKYQGLLKGTGSISLSGALKLDKEILEISREIEDLRLKQTFLEEALRSNSYDDVIRFDWEQFQLVSVESIMAELESVLEVPMQKVELITNRDLLAVEEQNREQKQSRRSLGFIQPEYELDASNEFRENLRFQVGIQLPIFDEDRVDKKIDELGLLDDLADSQDAVEELQKLVARIWLSAQFFKQDVDLLKSKKEQLTLFAEEVMSTDRALLIDVLEYQKELDALELKSNLDLLRIYVQAMSMSGDLARPPLRNFLEHNK